MKIAFATNDRKTIAQRTGQAKEFVIYEISNDAVIHTEYIENLHEHHHHHGEDEEHEHEHGHKDITDKLKTVDYLYVKIIGKHLKADVEQAGIKYVLTDENLIENVLADFFDEGK
jgi:predicted Fe-Mo cluster-binding NifX family protein